MASLIMPTDRRNRQDRLHVKIIINVRYILYVRFNHDHLISIFSKSKDKTTDKRKSVNAAFGNVVYYIRSYVSYVHVMP
jgi:hypothetical protein